jgi:hypothetical protein
MVGIGALMAVAAAIKGSLSDAEFMSSVTTMMLAGGAMFGAGAVMLPGWARRRRNQMDEIADRVSSETMHRLPDV